MNRRDLARAAAQHIADLRTHQNNVRAALTRHATIDTIDAAFDTHGRAPIPAPLAAPAISYRTHRAWERAAVVYAMHPAIVTELASAEPARVPAAALDHLPHPNPLIVWPDPPPCVDMDGGPARILAAYIVGVGGNRRSITTTDDPDRTGYRITVVARLPNGILEEGGIRLDTGPHDWFDHDTAIESAAHRSVEINTAAGLASSTIDAHTRALRSKIGPALDALLYVTSIGADLNPLQTRTRRTPRRAASTTKARSKGDANVLGVGWTLGPALDAPRHTTPEPVPGTTPATTKRPHPRRAYYATRWTGPGRTVPRNAYIRATYIHRDQLTTNPTPTIATVGAHPTTTKGPQ